MRPSRWTRRRTLTAALLGLSASAVGRSSGREEQADEPADLIVVAGRIWTGDPAKPWAEALACRRGEITAVGTRDEVLRRRGPATRLVEAPEGLATPGLVDAHGHIESLGRSLEDVDLRGVTSLEEVVRKVNERAGSLPAGVWVSGSNWDQSLWPGGSFPTASILDAVSPDRPVWLTRVDGHGTCLLVRPF